MLFRPRISKIVCGNTLLLTPHRNIRFATKKINLLDGFEKMEAPEEDMHVEPPELRVDTVYIGKEFELQVIKTLSKFGLNIKHTGQTADQGVDFRGTWNLPENKTFSVLGQCKKENKRVQPGYLREFEGVLLRNTPGTIGIFASFTGYTPPALALAMNSTYPLICCQLKNSQILAFHMNHKLQQLIPELSPGRVRSKDKEAIEYLVYTNEKGEVTTINNDSS